LGCASGAIGGATSAVLLPLTLDIIDPTHAPLDQGQIEVVAAFSTIEVEWTCRPRRSNAMAVATTAQSEALNKKSRELGEVKPYSLARQNHT